MWNFYFIFLNGGGDKRLSRESDESLKRESSGVNEEKEENFEKEDKEKKKEHFKGEGCGLD